MALLGPCLGGRAWSSNVIIKGRGQGVTRDGPGAGVSMPGHWQSLTEGPRAPQPGHLPAMRVTAQEHQCCSRPGCWFMPQCHWAVPVGVALPEGNLSRGEGWCCVTWEHHPAPSMISLGVSGLCPGRVLPCRAPSWSAASAAGLVASPEQGGERSQSSSWLSQLAPDGLCCPSGTCPRLATELPRHWQGRVPVWGCQEWAGGMRGFLLCHLLA